MPQTILGNFNHSQNSIKKKATGAFSNWQGQPSEVVTPSLSIYIDGGKPM
jgi:hypothetical protein